MRLTYLMSAKDHFLLFGGAILPSIRFLSCLCRNCSDFAGSGGLVLFDEKSKPAAAAELEVPPLKIGLSVSADSFHFFSFRLSSALSTAWPAKLERFFEVVSLLPFPFFLLPSGESV